jgi:hypothetical protein
MSNEWLPRQKQFSAHVVVTEGRCVIVTNTAHGRRKSLFRLLSRQGITGSEMSVRDRITSQFITGSCSPLCVCAHLIKNALCEKRYL